MELPVLLLQDLLVSLAKQVALPLAGDLAKELA